MANLSPLFRGVSTFLLILGAVLCADARMLGAGWLVLLGAAAHDGLLRPHLRLVGVFVVPLALSSLIIQSLVQPVGAGAGWLEQVSAAALPTAAMAFRIAFIAAAAQLCLLSILFDGRLIAFLRAWRLSDRALLVVMGGVTLLAEVNLRSRQVLEARRARGFGKATWWNAVREIPFILLPLLVYMLDAAGKRSEFWVHRNLRERVRDFVPRERDRDSPSTDAAWLLGSSAWCAAAVWTLLT